MFGIEPTLLNVVLNIIAVLGTGGLIGVFFRHRHAMRQLLNDDKKDIRDHYDKELLRVADRQKACEDRQRECEKRETELRDEINELKDEVAGLKRQIVRYSAKQVVLLDESDALGASVSEAVVKAAQRVTKITKGKNKPLPEDSDLLSSAKETVRDNRQALQSSKDTCAEVERREEEGGNDGK